MLKSSSGLLLIPVISACFLGFASAHGSNSSNSGAGQATSVPAGACSFLTAADVSGIVGVAVTVDDTSDVHNCTWSAEDPNDVLSELSVIVANNVDPEVFKEGLQAPLRGTPISGVGDAAYYTPEIMGEASLMFRKGDQIFDATIQPSGSFQAKFPLATIKADEKALALKVLSRL